MTIPNATFASLLERARAGDGAALDELARIYDRDIRIAARVHLGPALRPYLDSIDLVQSVHRSLLRGVRGQKLDLSDSKNLVALAITMVRRKIAKQWRRHRRQQRLNSSADSPEDVLASLAATNVNAERSVAVRETIGKLLSDLEPMDRQLLEHRLQGWNTAETAERLGQSPESLRIRLHRLRKRLTEAGVLAEWL